MHEQTEALSSCETLRNNECESFGHAVTVCKSSNLIIYPREISKVITLYSQNYYKAPDRYRPRTRKFNKSLGTYSVQSIER